MYTTCEVEKVDWRATCAHSLASPSGRSGTDGRADVMCCRAEAPFKRSGLMNHVPSVS
jgi:hypothetical protein